MNNTTSENNIQTSVPYKFSTNQVRGEQLSIEYFSLINSRKQNKSKEVEEKGQLGNVTTKTSLKDIEVSEQQSTQESIAVTTYAISLQPNMLPVGSNINNSQGVSKVEQFYFKSDEEIEGEELKIVLEVPISDENVL